MTPSKPILSADLAPKPTGHADLRAEHFTDVAVMSLSLTGATQLAKKCGAADTGMAVQISELLQEIASEHGITYLKFVGQDAIAAAGFDRQDQDAMNWIAALAIAVRDRLSELIDTAGPGAEFRIGLGFGGCYGCLVGRERQQFNLWGEAFETAHHHGALGRARRHPGERRRLCAAAPGLPVPAARHLLSAGRRPVAHLCAGGPAVTDAPSALMDSPSARYVRAPLAWVGRGVRARLRFLLSLDGAQRRHRRGGAVAARHGGVRCGPSSAACCAWPWAAA